MVHFYMFMGKHLLDINSMILNTMYSNGFSQTGKTIMIGICILSYDVSSGVK